MINCTPRLRHYNAAVRQIQKSNRWALLWATLILLIAAWLRLGAFHQALVGADQSSILAAAVDIASLRDAPVVGIKSSIGVMQTAITPYIASVPLFFLKRVIAVKWWFSVLDLFAIALLFRAVRRRFGLRAAVIATLLYAANPWVVEYVRWIWYQSLIATFSTTAFAGLLLLPHGRETCSTHTWVTVTMACAALMAMVHLAGVPWAALIMLLALVLAIRNKLWKGLMVGVILSTFIVLPYVIYLFKTGFADVGTILSGTGGESSGLNWASYRLSWELLGGQQVLATPRTEAWAQAVWSPDWLYNILPVMVILCAVLAMITLMRDRSKRAALGLTLAWLLLAPTLFVPTGIHLQHFYLMFIFPAPCVLVGIVMAYPVKSRLLQVGQHLGLIITILVVGWWSYLWTVRITKEVQGQLRAPTRAWLMDRTVDVVDAYLDAYSANQVIVLMPYEGGLSPFDWVRNFVNSDRVRVVSPGSGFIIPTSPTCYLLGPDATTDMLAPVADLVTNYPAMSIPADPSWQTWCYGDDIYINGVHARWQNGMALLDVDIEGDFQSGETLNITYRWLYETSEREREPYHIFNHVMFSGESVAQIDGTGVPAWYWREGDVLITHFTLSLPTELPNGEYSLITGFYTFPGLERIMLESGEGHREVQHWVVGPREPQKIIVPGWDTR